MLHKDHFTLGHLHLKRLVFCSFQLCQGFHLLVEGLGDLATFTWIFMEYILSVLHHCKSGVISLNSGDAGEKLVQFIREQSLENE